MATESYDDSKIAFGLNNFSNIKSSIAMIRNGINIDNYTKNDLFKTFLTEDEKKEWGESTKDLSFSILEMYNFLELFQFLGIKEFKVVWDKELKKIAKQKDPYFVPLFLKRLKQFSEYKENEWKQNAAILLILAYFIDNNIRYIDAQGYEFEQRHLQRIKSFFSKLEYNPKQTTKPYKPININIQKIRNGLQCLHDLELIQKVSKGKYFVKLNPKLLMYFFIEYQKEKKLDKNIPISDFVNFLRKRYLIFNTEQKVNFIPNYFTAGLYHLQSENKLIFRQDGDIKQPNLDSDSLKDKFTGRTNVIKLLWE